ERCGDGYMSTFETNKVGVAATLLRGAGRIFGGVLGQASYGSYEIQQAVGGPAHDAAMRRARTRDIGLARRRRRWRAWVAAQSGGSAGAFCGSCGAKLTADAKFCGDCGAQN